MLHTAWSSRPSLAHLNQLKRRVVVQAVGEGDDVVRLAAAVLGVCQLLHAAARIVDVVHACRGGQVGGREEGAAVRGAPKPAHSAARGHPHARPSEGAGAT